MSAAKIRDQYPATLRPSIIKDVLHSHSRCCCSNANELFFIAHCICSVIVQSVVERINKHERWLRSRTWSTAAAY